MSPLCNLPVSRKSTKAIVQAYEQAEEKWRVPVIDSVLDTLEKDSDPEQESEPEPEPQRDSAQRTLF